MLFLEFHGSESSVAEQAERFGEIAEGYGGGPFAWTVHPEERTKLWQARHDVFWALSTLRPGAKGVSTDICVPISRLADCVVETQEDAESDVYKRQEVNQAKVQKGHKSCRDLLKQVAATKAGLK